MIEATNSWQKGVVLVIAKHTPRCHDITRLISQSLDRPLPFCTGIKMRIHYLICEWCERYRNQLGFLREALHCCPERDENKAAGDMPARTRAGLKVVLRSNQ